MMTLRGDRRRTPGGTFFTLVKNNISDIERELLFPSGKQNLPDAYILDGLQAFSKTQLEIGVKRLDEKINEDEYVDSLQKAQLLKIKQLVLKRIAELQSQATNSSIAEIKEAVKDVQDPQAKSDLLKRVEELEKLSRDRIPVNKEIIDVELERERTRIQLEAEERRTKARARYWGHFLARESVATIVGSILLVIISIALLVAMFMGKVESKIIENGFLVLLGYFFGQTITRTKQFKERNGEHD